MKYSLTLRDCFSTTTTTTYSPSNKIVTSYHVNGINKLLRSFEIVQTCLSCGVHKTDRSFCNDRTNWFPGTFVWDCSVTKTVKTTDMFRLVEELFFISDAILKLEVVILAIYRNTSQFSYIKIGCPN